MTDHNDMKRGAFEWLRAERLTIDERYERPLSQRKVRKIVNDFDPDAFGVLYVSRREDGTIVILDGQHRQRSVLDMGWGDQKVPCFVYDGLSLADEAALFVLFNEQRTKPKPLDLHRAGVVAGNERAVAIEKVITDLGLSLIDGSHFRMVRAIKSLQLIHDNAGVRRLRETLQVAIDAWGSDASSFNGEVLVGIAAVITRFGRRCDHKRLARELHKQQPLTLLSRARMIKAEKLLDVRSSFAVVAMLIVQAYNWRLSEADRLTWDATRTGGAFWRLDEGSK